MDTDAEEPGAENPWSRLDAVVITGGATLAIALAMAGTEVRDACGHLALWIGPFACIYAFLALRTTREEGRAAAAWSAVRYGAMTAITAGRALLPDPVGLDVAVFGGLALTLFEAVPVVRRSFRRDREPPLPRLGRP